MGNIWRVFVRDIKRLAKAPAAWSVVLFLTLLPSLYTWFNVAAFWNPYDNTGQLRICVVNEDVAVDDAVIGHVALGDQIMETLQENNQLGWTFVSRDEAQDEVSSGRAYAAFIIPHDFSSNVCSITTGNFQKPTLEYYVNEKTGPVSPKITDTGANSLDTTINDTFFGTVSSTVARILNDKLAQTNQMITAKRESAAAKMASAEQKINEGRAALSDLNGNISGARDKISNAQGSLDNVAQRLNSLQESVDGMAVSAGNANTKLADTSLKISLALDDVAAKTTNAAADVKTNLSAVETTLTTARATLQSVDPSGTLYPELAKQLDTSIALLQNAETNSSEYAQAARTNATNYRQAVAQTAVPSLNTALGRIANASGDLKSALTSSRTLVDESRLALNQLDSTLQASQDALQRTDVVLADLSNNLSQVKTDLAALGTGGALSQIVGEDGVDPAKVADFMSSPTKIVTEQLYAVTDYGSAMAPLFMNLTLWIGVFMLMVIVRLEVDDEGIPGLTITQRFFGRGIILSLMATLQACICCAGCLIMGVQTASVALFFLTAIVASLSYLAVQYTLSSTLQHVGKAFCIVLVFVQIPGASGLYPIEMVPDFFKHVYPLFPFTYGINGIRETIAGFYGYAWVHAMVMLVGFLVAFWAIGGILRPYMTNLNRMFARQIKESDIINGESVHLPARRYRMSQIIRSLADHDQYGSMVTNRVMRFMNMYPTLKMVALVAGIGVPLISTTIMQLAGVDKVYILTSWLIWFLVVMTYLIVIEYLRDYLSHLMSLQEMSTEDLRRVYQERNSFTPVQPIRTLFTRSTEHVSAAQSTQRNTAVDNTPDESHNQEAHHE